MKSIQVGQRTFGRFMANIRPSTGGPTPDHCFSEHGQMTSKNMYLCKFNNVFVQIIKCICHALSKYLWQMLDTKGKYLLYLDKYVNIPLG